MGRARIADTDKLKELNAGIPRETDEHLSERCIDSLVPGAEHVGDEIVDACKEATNFYMDTLREEADFLEQGMSEIKQLTGEADGGSSS
jgi:hypothetical protein